MRSRLMRLHLLGAGVRLAGGGAAVPPASLLDGLVEYYTLDEAGPGTRVGDVASYDLTDVNNNMVGAGGKVGARALRGATNKYLRRQTTDLQFNGSFTLAGWFNIDGATTQDLFARWSSGAEWLLYLRAASPYVFSWRVKDAGGDVQVAEVNIPSYRAWHWVVAEFDSSGKIRIALNNATATEATFTADTPFHSGSSETTVGYAGNGYANNSRVDSVTLYNRLLTTDEKAALWNDGDGLDTLTAYPDRSLNWICIGDSLTSDYLSSVPGVDRWADQASALLGGGKYNDPTNLAVIGKTAAEMLADAPAQVSAYYAPGKTNLVTIWAGTNDLAPSGAVVADLQTTFQALCETWRNAGSKVLAYTMLPRNTGAAGGNQTQFNNNRATFNTWLRSNYTNFADGLVDVAADSNIGVSDTAYANTTYYVNDQTHLLPAGQTIVAGLAATAIDAIT